MSDSPLTLTLSPQGERGKKRNNCGKKTKFLADGIIRKIIKLSKNKKAGGVGIQPFNLILTFFLKINSSFLLHLLEYAVRSGFTGSQPLQFVIQVFHLLQQWF